MVHDDDLATRFEESRARLRAMAHRMLGSASDADDAIQEAWLKVTRADPVGIENPGAFLSTVVARVCLDMLRSRSSRREDPLAVAEDAPASGDVAAELAIADALTPALLVVLERLAPAERVAFVLHDMFDLSFEEIGRVVDRTPVAARQLASRARRRVRGGPASGVDLESHRDVVGAFLAALRAGDFEGLVAALSPDVVLRADDLAVRTASANRVQGAPLLSPETRGASSVAGALQGRARGASPAVIDGVAGAAWIVAGRVRAAFVFTARDGRIAEIAIVMEPGRIAEMEVGVA